MHLKNAQIQPFIHHIPSLLFYLFLPIMMGVGGREQVRKGEVSLALFNGDLVLKS